MALARRSVAHRDSKKKTIIRGGSVRKALWLTARLALLSAAALGFGGCGETAKPVTPAAANQVHSYFGSPFSVSSFVSSQTTIDHSNSQIHVSALSSTGNPIPQVSGPFTAAPTGFLSVAENFAAGVPDSSMIFPNPGQPLNGAWAVEIPGAGALANLLDLGSLSQPSAVPIPAGPAAMVENSVCPNFPQSAPFLYVTVPSPSNTAGTLSSADFGDVAIGTRGSVVTFTSQSFVIGSSAPASSTVAGACTDSVFGPLTTYPLNSFLGPGLGSSSQDRIGIGSSGLLIDSFSASGPNGAFGQNNASSGVLGVAVPSSPVDVGAVVGARYNGFIYAPGENIAGLAYDIHALAAAFGDSTATSQSCSSLQASLVANHGQGASTVAALPSPNSIYGGEFLTTTNAGLANDPSGANGSENCDVVIDLGQQDSGINGLFPNATIFIGSNYPPFSTANPWTCPATCAVSFPAAAVVGQVQGQFVIFVVGSPNSNPPAQLPSAPGTPASPPVPGIPQPVGIYLFQKSQ